MAVNPPDHFPNNREVSLYADDGSIFSQLTLEEMVTLKKKEVKSKMGRKLTFKEWLGLKVIRSKHKRAAKRMAKAHKTNQVKSISFTCCILLLTGLAGLFLPVLAVFSGMIGLFQVARGLFTGSRSTRSNEMHQPGKKTNRGLPKIFVIILALVALIAVGALIIVLTGAPIL